MIDVRYNHKSLFAGQRVHQRFHFLYIAELIVLAMHEELRLLTLAQKRKISVVHRRTKPDAFSHANIFATGAQPNEASETESRDYERCLWKLRCQKIERSRYVAAFAASAIM